MYVYCISKMESNNPTFLISKEELDQLDKETFSALSLLCTEYSKDKNLFDYNKFCKKYGEGWKFVLGDKVCEKYRNKNTDEELILSKEELGKLESVFKLNYWAFNGEEVLYWHKSYSIFNWFSKVVCSNRCEEGKYYLFTENHMKLLLNLCKEILNDSSKECVLLPLSNLNDEEYLMWAEYTYNRLKGIIKSADFKNHIFLYWAGW